MTDEIYVRFEKLKEEKGVTSYAVAKATGITTTTLTNWGKGKYTPKQDKLQLIADYFDVTLDYLVTGESYTIEETATLDVRLTELDNRLKEYMLKLNQLSNEKQECVMKLIDLLK